MTEIAHKTVRVSIDDTYFDAYLAQMRRPKGRQRAVLLSFKKFSASMPTLNKPPIGWPERAIWRWPPICFGAKNAMSP